MFFQNFSPTLWSRVQCENFFSFEPSLKLGLSLVTVLDHLRVPRVVGLGEGAGANIVLRFGLYHPNRVHGIFAINLSTSISRGRFMEALKVRYTRPTQNS